MTLLPGTRLGPYEIGGAIGAGGMGEVFRARDTKLNRDVAIKVLPPAFAQHPERLARFEREARLLASLNHSNIAHVYGFESAALPDGSTAHFLAMEMIEGEDLAERLKRGAIPLDESLAIAKQIAEGLEEAHEKGIVHRDLKPANVKVTPDGKVKVLDFGLAKAMEGDPSSPAVNSQLSHSPTMSRHMTEAGMIMGTAAYMSPEQARGKAVDKRADIWSFGVVLFEMLTGTRLFAGETVSDVLVSVLTREPDWPSLPTATPGRVCQVLRRCLERDPKKRLRDIGEVPLAIDGANAGAPVFGLSGTAVSAPAPTRRVAPLVIATAAVTIIATLVLTRWLMSGAAVSGAIAHVSVALPDGDELGILDYRPLALSEDGTHIAYVGLREGKNRIYVRTMSEPTPNVLEGTEGAEGPFFSPDGQWLAFFAGARLKKITVGGASLQALADAPSARGGTWGSDGYIYFAPTANGGIWRVASGGGPAREVTRKDAATGENSHRWPHFAGTNTLLFGMRTGPGTDEGSVAVQTIGGSEHHILVKGGEAPRYAAKPGLLLYSHVGQLFAVPWRPPQEDLGQAVPVAMSERTKGTNESASNYAVSADGTLVYLAGGRTGNASRLVWIDRAGRIEAPPLPERYYASAKVSADGKRAIVEIKEGTIALWMYDFARNSLTPIGSSAFSSQAPVWTADGARVIYRATRKGLRNLYWRSVDGSGEEEPLTTKAEVIQTPSSVSPDGHWLVFNESGAQESGVGGIGMWVMRLDGDRTPRRLFPAPAGESNGQLSPDGKWIAYEAPVSSRREIYVAPFPGPGPVHQVSIDGGVEPLWSRDGRELFFQQGAALIGVRVTPNPSFSAGAPRVQNEVRFARTITQTTGWSITPDGSRFLRIQRVEPEQATTRIDLVQNWFEEVKAKVTAR